MVEARSLMDSLLGGRNCSRHSCLSSHVPLFINSFECSRAAVEPRAEHGCRLPTRMLPRFGEINIEFSVG